MLMLPRATEALRTFEASLGGRDKLADRLLLADLDDKQKFFLGLLMDPNRAKDSLARLCRDAGLNPVDLLDLHRKASFAVAQTVATNIAAEAIPAITADLASKSADRYIECSTCRGKTTVKTGPQTARVDIECPACAGTGQVFVPSDLDRQKTLLDMLGLGHKAGGGLSITQNNTQVAGSAVGALFSTFVKATDKAAYDVDATTIEGEVVK